MPCYAICLQKVTYEIDIEKELSETETYAMPAGIERDVVTEVCREADIE